MNEKNFLKVFFIENLDYKIFKLDDNEKLILFKNIALLNIVTNKKKLLEKYKKEFSNVKNNEELIQYILEYIIREGILLERKLINNKEFLKIIDENS